MSADSIGSLVTIYKRTSFESAHQLEGHPKCGRLHGHSYKVEVWITGRPAGRWRFVYDFVEIKDYFQRLDHSNVINTRSAEVMALEAAEHFHGENVTRVVVRIWETSTCYAEAVSEGG